MNKKILPILLILLFAVTCLPPAARAASGTIDTDGTYDIGVFGNDSVITIDSLASTAGLTVTLTNTAGIPYTNLRIDCIDAGMKLTINGVQIDNSLATDACALAFHGTGNTLTLAGSSSLTSGYNEPGVRVEEGDALSISGGGTLSATGGNFGAGIGAGRQSDAGTITILGGSVTANGGFNAAGIGGGSGELTGFSGDVITTDGGGGGVITIQGGTVAAYGGESGAGIGGGTMGGGGVTTIEGGSVTAVGIGGAGIGGGACPAYISNAKVILAGNGDGGVITISGGVIAASSRRSGSVLGPGAGIGGGFSGEGGVITITGGVITANSSPADGSYFGSAGIGGGAWNDGGVITVQGGEITASGTAGGAGIGGGHKFYLAGYTLLSTGAGAGGTITIEDGRVVAVGGNYAAGIGGGGYPTAITGGSGGTIVISGGITYAQGDAAHSAYDIGSGSNSTDGALTISGTASVFLRYDNCLQPTLPVPHTHKTTTDAVEPMEVVFGTIYGLPGTGVSPWTSALGGYFLLDRIVYDANGGDGSVSNTAVVPGMAATVKPGIGLWNTGYGFTYWNTAANGSGTNYIPYSTVTLAAPSITLYAQWELLPPTGDPAAAGPYLFPALALLSLGAIAGMGYRKAKKRKR